MKKAMNDNGGYMKFIEHMRTSFPDTGTVERLNERIADIIKEKEIRQIPAPVPKTFPYLLMISLPGIAAAILLAFGIFSVTEGTWKSVDSQYGNRQVVMAGKVPVMDLQEKIRYSKKGIPFTDLVLEMKKNDKNRTANQ